jgi:hypothetical protein
MHSASILNVRTFKRLRVHFPLAAYYRHQI